MCVMRWNRWSRARPSGPKTKEFAVMHSLIHQEFATATARSRVPYGHRPGPQPPDPPPQRKAVRSGAAVVLAALAGRLDRDAARRAVA
jgi:hypothetical protein